MSTLGKPKIGAELKLLKEMQPIVDKLIVLETEEDALIAAEYLLKARQVVDQTNLKCKEYSVPLNDLLAKLKSEFNEVISPFTLIETQLKPALVQYVLKQNEEADIRLQDMRDKVGDQTLQLDLTIDNLTTNSGVVRFRNDLAITLEDESLVPKKYLKSVVDMKSIEKALELNPALSIPGIKLKKTKTAALYVKK